MGKKRSSGLTPGQQEWRRHLEACARSGETMRGYAKRLELSESAMYQAAKDLRRRGVLPKRARSRSAQPGLHRWRRASLPWSRWRHRP